MWSGLCEDIALHGFPDNALGKVAGGGPHVWDPVIHVEYHVETRMKFLAPES